MITLNNFTKLDNNQYQMVLSMKKTDSVEDLPSETRPMSPEYFAVTVDYGTPAYGSVVIKEGGDILSYSAGKWGKAGTAGDIKLKELSVKENGEYLPESSYVGFNKVVVDVKPKEPPVKGDIIVLSNNRRYRVLKIDGTIAEIFELKISNWGNGYPNFSDNKSNVYGDSRVGTAINVNYYNSFSTEIKNAIIPKTFTQDVWGTSGSPEYTGIGWDKSITKVGLQSLTYGESITRNCYLLSVQDIIDYLEVTPDMTEENTTLTPENALKMFDVKSTYERLWLRSAAPKDAYPTGKAYMLGLNTMGSLLWGEFVDWSNSAGYNPAFQIDLSKVSWTKSE